jgi:hypothetical protein
MLMRLRQLKQLLLHLNAFLVIFYDGLSGVSSGPSLTGLDSKIAKKSPNGPKGYGIA